MTVGPVRRSCAGCGARLAGDNPATVCGPCQQDAAAGRRPPPVSSRVWSAVEVRAACRRRHVGDLIRAYRYLAGSNGRPLSQEQVAEWLGVTQPQLSRIETGPAVTDLNRLIRWATTLGIPPELLWFRTDNPDDSTAATTGTRPAIGGPRSRSVVLSVEVDRRGGRATGAHRSLPVELAGQVGRSYAALAGCDIVHDHTLAGLYVSQTNPALPVVTTNHGPFTAPELADVYWRTAHRVPVIAISADQAAGAGPAGIAVAAVIHHGLDLDAYRYNPHGGDYVAVLGRMHPDKGIDRAITLARPLPVGIEPGDHEVASSG